MPVAAEQVLIEALVVEPEALDEAVLHRLVRRDVVPLDAAVLLPSEHRIRCQLRTVVADHKAGMAAPLGDGIQLAGDELARDRVVHHHRKTFPAEVVDHAQDAEPSSAPAEKDDKLFYLDD